MTLEKLMGVRFVQVGPFLVGFATITPAMARELLLRNTSNRNVKRTAVAKFSRDMESGNWRPTGEAIKFDANGTLLDGQNRLIACVESGVDFVTLVILSVPASAQEQMDSGIGRTTADNFSMAGIKSSTTVTALVTLVWRYSNGVMMQNGAPTHAEANALLDDGVIASAAFVVSHKPPRGIGSAAISLIHYYGSQFSRDKANFFVSLLQTGAGLPAGSPILTLRTAMASAVWANQPGWSKMSKAISAWNAWAEGRELRALRLANDFPSIIGAATYSGDRLIASAARQGVRTDYSA